MKNQKLQNKQNYIEHRDVIKCFIETYGVQSSFSALASRLLIKFDILGFIKLFTGTRFIYIFVYYLIYLWTQFLF